MAGVLSLAFFAPLVAVGTTGPAQGRVRLNTGQMMPYINCGGTSQAVKPGDHYSNYTEFIRQGGRGIDTALTYTDPINEQIAAALKVYPEVRDEIFLTTKVPCCPSGSRQCSNPEYNGTVRENMQRNNALLQVNTTDLTLLHHPCQSAEESIQLWLELEQALAEGLTRAIGVSNFGADLLKQLISDPRTKVVPAVNQCNHAIANHNESHNPQTGGDDDTVAFCKAHNISYSAYSPLEGLNGHDVFELPEVIAIGKVHNVSGAQVAFRWLIQQEITAVTAAHNPEYIAEDIDVFDFELTPAEMATLSAI